MTSTVIHLFHGFSNVIQQSFVLHSAQFQWTEHVSWSLATVTAVFLVDDNTHTHTHSFNGPFPGTIQMSRYQKGKTNLDFTEARDSEWQWQQLGDMQDCTLLQTDYHTSTPPLCFLQARCPSCRPTNSVKALKAKLLTTTMAKLSMSKKVPTGYYTSLEHSVGEIKESSWAKNQFSCFNRTPRDNVLC